MWACLITTNPNWYTFSLLHFQCTSHFSEYHGSDVGLCPHFCPEPVILWGQLPWAPRCVGSELRGGAWPPFITACSSSYPCFLSGSIQFFVFPLLSSSVFLFLLFDLGNGGACFGSVVVCSLPLFKVWARQ